MKILFFSYKFYPDIGGIESISEMLATYFVDNGHVVHIVTTSPNNDHKEFPYAIIRNPTIIQLLKEFTWADVIFENNLCLRLSWLNFIFKRPSIVTLQTWINLTNSPIQLQNKLKFYWLSNATHVVACSDSIRSATFPKAVLIGNPYDNKTFRVKPHIKKNKDFVFLGRLVSDKGVSIAIEAFHKFLQRNTTNNYESKLTIIGDGNERIALEKLVEEYHIADKVLFMGGMRGEALVDLLNQHRYILIPSLWNEPFGIVALEGMACGCVPIVSDGGGLPDAIGKAGLVCKRGDVESLVSCMLTLKTNPALENQLREAATFHLLSYQSKTIGSSYLNVMNTL